MFESRTFHDTYYIVAHFDWLVTLTLASLVVLSAAHLVRRWSNSRTAGKLRHLALACWAFGLALSLGTTVAWKFFDVSFLTEKIWLLSVLNQTSSVAAFILLLAVALCFAMIVSALWHRLFGTRR